MPAPIPMRYEGDGEFRTLTPRWAKAADEGYVIGEVYPMAAEPAASKKSRDHYFAVVGEAFKNLPEAYDGRWPTDDHLRKWALIKAGYSDERSIVCASKAEALRVAAFVKPMDPYAVVVPSEAVVTVYTAKSQKLKAMGAKEFKESKDAVLGVLADLLDVTPEALSRAA